MTRLWPEFAFKSASTACCKRCTKYRTTCLYVSQINTYHCKISAAIVITKTDTTTKMLLKFEAYTETYSIFCLCLDCLSVILIILSAAQVNIFSYCAIWLAGGNGSLYTKNYKEAANIENILTLFLQEDGYTLNITIIPP